MGWKQYGKRIIPPSLLNRILLQFPFLYQTNFVYYETNFLKNEIDGLLHQLKTALIYKGDIIECGSSRCGTSIIMANFLRSNRVEKTIYAMDSFEGFDRVELRNERKAGLTTIPETACSSTSYEYVKSKIKKLGLEDQVIPIPGFFKDTLTDFEAQLCFALVDCDLKESILYCAETIWPHLVSGGRMVFDDYTSQKFQGAKLGIDQFVTKYADKFSGYGLSNNFYWVSKK